MSDKAMRICLLLAVIIIGMLLLRPGVTNPIRQQPATKTQPIMVVDNATIYVLSDNKIYVYYWDGPATRNLKQKIGVLKLAQVVDAKIGN